MGRGIFTSSYFFAHKNYTLTRPNTKISSYILHFSFYFYIKLTINTKKVIFIFSTIFLFSLQHYKPHKGVMYVNKLLLQIKTAVKPNQSNRNEDKKMKKSIRTLCACGLCITLLGSTLTGCSLKNNPPTSKRKNSVNQTELVTSIKSKYSGSQTSN